MKRMSHMKQMPQMPHMNQKDRADWYDRSPAASRPDRDATSIKVTKQDKGIMANGYSNLPKPEDKTTKPLHLASTRDNVSGPFKLGPGNQHKGKASPTISSDCVYVKPNKEMKAKG